MLLSVFPAQALATNCYVIARAAGEDCVIVDPGVGVEAKLQEVLQTHRLTPAGVILTHGHLDHVYAVAAATETQIPAYIHAADRYRLEDPLADVSAQLLAMVEQEFGQRAKWSPPREIVEVEDADTISLAGFTFLVRHAPGHTQGSALFVVQDVPDGVQSSEALESTVLSGDVLFAGAIGRTDLPGGDPVAMERSLREVVLAVPDSALVLPGHGPASTMRRERIGNPFLQGLDL